MDMRIGRHEGGVECPFREDRPEMVGKPQRHEEGVGQRTGAQDRREHDVAREAGDPREKSIAADGENAPEHWIVLPQAQNAKPARRAQP
jgi:hypothetical protein